MLNMYFDRCSINRFVIINKLYIPPHKNIIYYVVGILHVHNVMYILSIGEAIFGTCKLIFAMFRSPVANKIPSYLQCHAGVAWPVPYFFHCALHLTALAIYTRSPAAFRAVRSLGILQLPCCKELQRIVSRNADGPGIREQYLANESETYKTFCESKVASGGKKNRLELEF